MLCQFVPGNEKSELLNRAEVNRSNNSDCFHSLSRGSQLTCFEWRICLLASTTSQSLHCHPFKIKRVKAVSKTDRGWSNFLFLWLVYWIISQPVFKNEGISRKPSVFTCGVPPDSIKLMAALNSFSAWNNKQQRASHAAVRYRCMH